MSTRLALTVVLIAFSTPAFAGQAFAPEQLEFFEKKIRPVLVDQCYKCHTDKGEKGVKGGLWLNSRESILKGGDSGPALTLGNPDKSLLVEAVRYSKDDLQMPPKHRLSPEQVKDLEEWVRIGAPAPATVATPAPSIDFAKARNFWSLRPIANPRPPEVKDASWPLNDIDRFLLARMEQKSLEPNPAADPRTLIRRITYDLTGLPPTPAEVREFVAASSSNQQAAIHNTVARMLASPAYGERWGRHWLDVVRYADTSGCNSDFPIPSAHRYRDWVIAAFNRDLPYDQFLREQIAGDLLPAASQEEHFQKVVATGYLAIARRFGSQANEFHLTLEDIIDNLGKATMGLSLGCARCHDHKFDPVSTRDYYALYGIFNSSIYAFPGTKIFRHTKDFTPLVAEPEASKFIADSREAFALDEKIESLKVKKRVLMREERSAIELAMSEGSESDREPQDQPICAPAGVPAPRKCTSSDVQQEIDAAKDRLAEIAEHADAVPKAYAVMEGKPRNTRIQRKGEPGNLGDKIPRGFLTVLGGQTLPAKEKGSGRFELTGWLTDKSNPLTARVMVNRIWQYHFGRGLVKSPNDFGVLGERPTHPELLDWLASRFIESGWSVKSMHKLIIESRAYQMSSMENPECSPKDVANDNLWHFNRRRMEAEELRDSILAISGTLDRSPGGRHPFPAESEWKYTQHKPFVADFPSSHRSVYLVQRRSQKNPYLELFDGADTNATTAVRPASQTPVQALWALNSPLANDQARKLAERLLRDFSDEPARISNAFELAIGRPAEPDEIDAASRHIAETIVALADSEVLLEDRPLAAYASFARVLLTSNEFVFID